MSKKRKPLDPFTVHGTQRLQQRCTLPKLKILLILDRKECVDIGKEPLKPRQHFLFYSVKDDKYYVVIQDYFNGDIITVLFSEYHKKLAWEITPEQYEEAKAIAIKATTKVEVAEPIVEPIAAPPKNPTQFHEPTVFRMKAHYRNNAVIEIGKIPKTSEVKSLQDVINMEGINEQIRESLIKVDVPSCQVWCISFKFGKEVLSVDWVNDNIEAGT